MALVKNPILLPLQSLIGLQAGHTPVNLDDENISLTLPVVPEIVRRAGAIAPTGGWFQGILENFHSSADSERSNIDPYEPGASRVAPYPASVPDGLDVWLLGASGIQSGSANALTAAALRVNVPDHAQGWGEDDVSAPVITTPAFIVASWDSLLTTISSLGSPPFLTEQGLTYQPINLRLPRGRGAQIVFDTESSGVATFQCMMLLGLFPSGLGQDVVT